ncbi:oligosaccharide flippase family protein [Curtobacterium citreum]|uniref:oligosaccharide flippase family protein n=1 Tax=Curtobacterium citreum TaxID=2036 RepID=UPI000AA5759E|nr:oligosaccharide flippase family protein [Curtobacterium citreum]
MSQRKSSPKGVRKQSKLRDLGAAAVGNMMAPLASFASAPILAQALGVSERGELAAATAPFLFASIAATVGVPESITFFTARRRGGTGLVWRSIPILAVVSVLAALVIYFAAPLIAAGDARLSLLIQASGVSLLPTAVLAALRGAAAGHGDWIAVRNERVIGAVARLAPIAVLAALGSLTVTSAAAIIVLSPLIGALAFIRLRHHPRSAEVVLQRNMLGYGWRVWIGSLSGILLSRLDQILLNPLAGPRELGLYVVAVNISDVTLIVMTTVTSIMFTQDARERDDAVLAKTARLTFATMLLVSVVVGASLPLWVEPFFGAGFHDSIPAAWVMLATYALTAPGVVAGTALGARGRPGSRSTSLIVAVVVNCAAVVLLAPHLGALGTALATFLGNGTAAALNLFFLHKRIGVEVRHFHAIRVMEIWDLWRAVRSRLVRES